jgi:hypothetical protein
MSVLQKCRPAFGPLLIWNGELEQTEPMNAPSIGFVSGFRKRRPHGRGRNVCFAGYQSPGFQYHSRKFCELPDVAEVVQELDHPQRTADLSQPNAGGGSPRRSAR